MSLSSIGPNGVTIPTHAQIVDFLINGDAQFPGFATIYPNANTNPNSPDGAWLAIMAQAMLDGYELTQQVATSFDPEQAVGVPLDNDCAINGVTRRAGTPTLVNINVTVTQALTLPGIDTNPDAPFTVSDSVGNQYQLISQHVFSGAGSSLLAFQSTVLGPVEPAANSITVIVTTTLGVSAVNNPSTATTVGTTEESDYALRIRRAQSVSKPSVGYVGSVEGALYSVDGVTDVEVLENDTSSVDADGVPAHGIWVIVAGTATSEDIATAIYQKRHAGTDQKGDVTVPVLQADGTYFDVKFSRPTAQDLWISFDVAAVSGTVDPTYIREQLLAQLSYNINQSADTTTIVALIKAIAPNASVSSEGVSADGVTYVSLLAPAAVENQFATASVRIIINGTPGT